MRVSCHEFPSHLKTSSKIWLIRRKTMCGCGCWERKSNNLENSCCPLPLSIIFPSDRSARMANSRMDCRPALRMRPTSGLGLSSPLVQGVGGVDDEQKQKGMAAAIGEPLMPRSRLSHLRDRHHKSAPVADLRKNFDGSL
jgi:hypothetical protein